MALLIARIATHYIDWRFGIHMHVLVVIFTRDGLVLVDRTVSLVVVHMARHYQVHPAS